MIQWHIRSITVHLHDLFLEAVVESAKSSELLLELLVLIMTESSDMLLKA